jgi:hypothetical protein
MVEIETNKKINVEYLPITLPQWDATDNRISNSKVTSHTGWIPYVGIENKGIAKTVDEMKSLFV